MSKERKALKIASFVMFIWSVATLVFTCFFASDVATREWQADGIVMLVICALFVIFGFGTSVKGIKGANTPSKANSCVAVALILSLLLALSAIFCILAFFDEGVQAIDGDMPFFVAIVFGLLLSLFTWRKAKQVFEASKDAI